MKKRDQEKNILNLLPSYKFDGLTQHEKSPRCGDFRE